VGEGERKNEGKTRCHSPRGRGRRGWGRTWRGKMGVLSSEEASSCMRESGVDSLARPTHVKLRNPSRDL
jgi:hypothetical protein